MIVTTACVKEEDQENRNPGLAHIQQEAKVVLTDRDHIRGRGLTHQCQREHRDEVEEDESTMSASDRGRIHLLKNPHRQSNEQLKPIILIPLVVAKVVGKGRVDQ